MDKSSTNIERKVVRNTFVNNSNNLRVKDESVSRQSLASRSRFNASISNLNYSSSIQFSISQSIQRNLLHSPSISFNDSIGNDTRLYETLNQACAGTLITLPGEHIKVSNLVITAPVIIQGQPGTVLEITDGSITADFRSASAESFIDDERAVFWEMKLIFNVNKRAYMASSKKSPLSLFIVDACSTHLEIRDWEIKSVINECHNLNFEQGESIWELQDCWIWMNGYATRKDLTQSRFNSSVYVLNCNIMSFAEFAKCGFNSTLKVEGSHISEITGTALLAINPRWLSISTTVIEKAVKTSVELRFFTDETVEQSPSQTQIQEQCMQVTLDQNEIHTSGGYGVKIYSETLGSFPLDISIVNNRIYNNRKQGCWIKNLTLSELKITGNDFNDCKNAWLHLENMKKADGQILIAFNRIFDSRSMDGWVLINTSALVDNNECYKNRNAGILVMCQGTFPIIDLHIRRCTINKNGENGLTILEPMSATVMVENSRIFDNASNGIQVICEAPPSARGAKKQIVPTEQVAGSMTIQRWEIKTNSLYGMYCKNMHVTFDETSMAYNTKGAIFVDKATKDLLSFRDAKKIRSFIEGKIGGEWGNVFPEKKRSCNGGECNLL